MSRFQALVYSRAEGFVHRSIPDAVAAIHALGARNDVAIDATDDPSVFATEHLARYAVLVFVHTSGNVVPEPRQREGLERYMAGGGGFFGVHAASSMDPRVRQDWPWFRELVGASFTGHTVARLYCDEMIERRGVVHAGPLTAAPHDAEPLCPTMAMTSLEPAVVHVEDPGSPAIRGITDGEIRDDEWYGFDENPRPYVQVVATVDESTYEPFKGEMGDDHPIVWWREFGGGRSVYNSMGHAAGTWRDDSFLQSVLGGIELAAGVS